MTFTYSSTAPATTLVARVRTIVGDTIQAQALLQDEQIEAFAAAHGNTTNSDANAQAVAILAVEAMLAAVASNIDASSGPVTLSRSQRTTHLRDLRDRLVARQASRASPRFTGLVSGDSGYVDTRLRPGEFDS